MMRKRATYKIFYPYLPFTAIGLIRLHFRPLTKAESRAYPVFSPKHGIGMHGDIGPQGPYLQSTGH